MWTWIVNAIAAAVVIVTLLPLVRKDAWWIRGCEFPRVQILTVALAALAALAWTPAGTLRTVLAGTLGAATLLQAFRILPFTPLWYRRDSPAVDAGDGDTLGILASNILMTNRQAEPFLARVREVDPDVLLVVEADAWWQGALAPLTATYPHSIEHPRDNTYGMLLYSKFQLEDKEVRFLVEDTVPSVKCAVVLPDSRRVTFYGLHPQPPAPQEATETTERDAELLLVADEVRGSSTPTIVAGDLNDVAWSYTTRLFRRVSGLLDPRIGRGLYSTFPAARPWLRFPLDHLFHSIEFGLVDLERIAVPGSDHLSIYARLRCVPEAIPTTGAPTPEGNDLEVVQEKIDRGLQDETD